MIKKIILIILAVILFVLAFFAFAPENRVYAVRHWIQLQLKDPVAHCLEHYKKDFLSPESVRVVEGSINYDSQKRFFDMKLSGVTLEDGKPYTEVVCIGNYSDKRMYISNQELEKEIMNRESAKGMEKLDEWLNMMKEKTERLKKEAELERRRWRN